MNDKFLDIHQGQYNLDTAAGYPAGRLALVDPTLHQSEDETLTLADDCALYMCMQRPLVSEAMGAGYSRWEAKLRKRTIDREFISSL